MSENGLQEVVSSFCSPKSMEGLGCQACQMVTLNSGRVNRPPASPCLFARIDHVSRSQIEFRRVAINVHIC